MAPGLYRQECNKCEQTATRKGNLLYVHFADSDSLRRLYFINVAQSYSPSHPQLSCRYKTLSCLQILTPFSKHDRLHQQQTSSRQNPLITEVAQEQHALSYVVFSLSPRCGKISSKDVSPALQNIATPQAVQVSFLEMMDK